MLALESDHGLEGFERLNRSLETDRSRLDVVFDGRLSRDRTYEIVSQNMRPQFLADKFRCLAAQDAHLQRLLERSQIQLGVPARPVELREIVLGEFACIQQRRDDDEGPDAKAWLLDLDATFSNHQELGERIVRLPVDGSRLRRFEPFDNVIVFAQVLATAEVGLSIG